MTVKGCLCLSFGVTLIVIVGVVVAMGVALSKGRAPGDDLVTLALNELAGDEDVVGRLSDAGAANLTGLLRGLILDHLARNSSGLVAADALYERVLTRLRLDIFVFNGLVAAFNGFWLSFIIMYTCARTVRSGKKAAPAPIHSPPTMLSPYI
ncbi:ORF10R [Ictalurid herpesvirus 1]|nr:ORF10L [Ictalurid herpesvirus 1]QAB08571.1 ORF10R [Ictalurid herpesvirus 1]